MKTLLLITLLFLSLTFCSKPDKAKHYIGNYPVKFAIVVQNGHDFIIVYDYRRIGLAHSPDCRKCNRKEINEK